jgi:hypothetical protein
MATGIYKFCKNFGRKGYLDGIFVADSEDVQRAHGETAYFGDVLGKHSEVYCEVDEDDLVLISDNPSDVEVFNRLYLSVGYNPLDYISDTDDEDEGDGEE